MHKLKTCGKNQATKECTEGFQRVIADFVCFHCPLVASAEAIPPATMKVKQHGCAVRRGQGGDRKAPLSPPQRRNPPLAEKSSYGRKNQQFGRAHLARHSIVGRKSSLGALLRKRKVTGRDASLPAPLLSTFGILVTRGTVGALPQTPPEAPPLDSARGNFPLDPFRAIELASSP